MPQGEASITVNAPPETVFDYVSDLATHPDWAGNPLTITKTSDGPVGIGSTYASRSKFAGTTQRDSVTVIEYDPPRRFAYETEGQAGIVRHLFEMTPSAGGTTVRKWFRVEKPSFMIRVIGPVTGMLARKGLHEDLRKIKERLEAPR